MIRHAFHIILKILEISELFFKILECLGIDLRCMYDSGFAKVFLITLNSLFGLLGLAMLGIGGYVMVEVKKYSVSQRKYPSRAIVLFKLQGVTEASYDAIPIFILCLGLFVFLLSFLGLFGACKENKCMGGTYAVVLSILVLCQISAGIAGFVKDSFPILAIICSLRNAAF